MPARSLPLADYERFHTRDLDEARAQVGDTFVAPHRLCLGKRETRLDVRMNGAIFDRTGLFCLDYGAEVFITAGVWGSCFLVEIPLAGAAEVSWGREQVVTTPRRASVLSPTEHISMRRVTPHLVIRFDRVALESHLGGMLGRELRGPLVFSLGMDLTASLSRSWLSLVNLLRREAETDGYMLTQPLALTELEGLLMTQLLLAQPSNYTAALWGEQSRVPPPVVERAVELIEVHAAEPLTVADIAETVGVGVRALREAFRRHLDTTPTGYLRDVRLDRARAELTVSEPGSTTVTEVAHRWGFVHPDRFSLAYQQRFGESPSETPGR